MDSDGRIRVTVLDDYDIIVRGVANVLQPYSDEIDIVELNDGQPVSEPVDIVLFDSFAQGEAHLGELQAVIDNPHARSVVMYTWNTDDDLITVALERGVAGYVAKQLPADDLVAALRRVHAGEIVVAVPDTAAAIRRRADRPWPGREYGLTEREAEVIALVCTGLSNEEIADKLYISANSLKTHIRNLYRKIGVDSRTKAVLWGVEHGFHTEHRRIDDWRSPADGAAPS